MKTKQSNKKHILLRYSLVIGLMLLFSCFVVWDLFKTSVLYADKWNNKADSIINRVTTLPPERGQILADNGSELAANLRFYTVRIDWFAAGIKDSVFMANVYALGDSLAVFDSRLTAQQWSQKLIDDRQRIMDRAAKTGKRNHAYALFNRPLRHDEYARVKKFPFFNINDKNKTGFYAEPRTKRTKPYGAMASRSIGIVAQDSISSEEHGRSGLEMALDSLLYGIPGVAHKIQLTNNIVDGEKVPPIKGYDITTTINIALQDIVETELYSMCREANAEWGTAVLMEVATGEIKAISNLTRSNDDYVEGRNNAVTGYEPGSVMKPITMMMALEDGVITNIDEPMVTGTMFMYGGRPIKDPHGGAMLTPREIIATSSNVGMSRIVLRKYEQDPGKFRDRLEEMGFFEPFNTGIGGEQRPIIKRLGRTTADRVALTRMAFGYSTLIPPLYTLAMYNAIANDGKYVRPHLVKKLSRDGEPDSIIPVQYIRKQVCSPENAQKLRIMLRDVVWSNRGTAHRFLQDSRVEIAGKTGTAFTIKNGQYTTERRFAFCGFFPYEKPKYSCIVLMLGCNRGAAASSGVVLKNIALKMYARGMLGDQPQYADAEQRPSNDGKALLYACADNKSRNNIKIGLGLRSVNTFKTPATPAQGVPDVKGMGAREAIRRLEDKGLIVSFTGNGYVVAQNPAPGATFHRGQAVELTLSH